MYSGFYGDERLDIRTQEDLRYIRISQACRLSTVHFIITQLNTLMILYFVRCTNPSWTTLPPQNRASQTVFYTANKYSSFHLCVYFLKLNINVRVEFYSRLNSSLLAGPSNPQSLTPAVFLAHLISCGCQYVNNSAVLCSYLIYPLHVPYEFIGLTFYFHELNLLHFPSSIYIPFLICTSAEIHSTH